MTTSFPLDPEVNDIYQSYYWDGNFWKKLGQDAVFEYLEESALQSTYLTQSSASTNYATKTELANINLSSASVGIVSAIVDSAPSTLDTLNELAAALGDDANFSSTVTTSLGNKLDSSSASITYLTKSSASTTYVSKSGANYQMSNATATTVSSATPTTIASLTITTNGRPVFLVATGDANPASAGDWHYIALYRDATRVGKLIINQTSGASHNNPWALTHIDIPSSGTYTYTVKANQGAGTITYGETGNDQAPTLIAIELF
jgi:hypothetical protein